jgi:hypothetical protein
MPKREHMYQPMELAMRAVLDIQSALPMAACDHARRLQDVFGMSKPSAYRIVALAAYVLNRELPAYSRELALDRRADAFAMKGTRPGPKRRTT